MGPDCLFVNFTNRTTGMPKISIFPSAIVSHFHIDTEPVFVFLQEGVKRIGPSIGISELVRTKSAFSVLGNPGPTHDSMH